MPGPPVVSIVIPCYNHGHFLAEALASVGTPAVRTEILVVDDGSTDDTPEVVSRFETVNDFRAIRQPNRGLAAARNRGLQESRGRYVIFLDADDRLTPGAVDIGVSTLAEHPECAFVSGRCRMMDRDGTLLPTPQFPRIAQDHYRELLRRNYIWMPAMAIFRREVLRRVGGFNERVNASADYEMYLRIARYFPVFDHGQVVAEYRKHDTNMSGNAALMLRETLTVLRGERAFIEGDSRSLVAYEEGWRNWQEFYGTLLVTEIRSDVRASRWSDVFAKTLALGRYHPGGLWHHALKKSQLTAKRVARRPAH